MSNPRIPYSMASHMPALPDFAGKRLIVQVVVNVEHWQFDQPMPRTVVTPPHGRETVPDVPNFAWAEYGMRRGMPRLFALLKEFAVPAGASCNAGVIDAYPECAAAIRDAGWEFIGHGVHQRAVQGSHDEPALINTACDMIAGFTGARPRGWLSPGLRETYDSPEHLRAAGIDYVFDWVLDDLPCWMRTANGPLLAMPYTLELNDSVVYAVERHATGEMLSRLQRSLQCLDAELAQGPRVITLALHPHLIAVPHRIGELRAMLQALATHPQAVFAAPAQIADWFIAARPA